MTDRREFIVCVDDERAVVQSLKQELRLDPFFRDVNIEISDSPVQVPDLVDDILAEGGDILVMISDQRMPMITGDELLLGLRGRIPDCRNVLLTGFSDLDAVVRLVNNNALYRYLAKPWDRHDLVLTVKDACSSYRQKRVIDELSGKIESLHFAMVSALENANQFFDEETGNHVRRISILSEFIARRAGLDEPFVKTVKLYSPLHDIGKVGIDKEVLLKPGRLTHDEFEHVKQHVSIGSRIIGDDGFDAAARNIILYHHEKWDGSGYLSGLAGKDIPIEARIVSIADVFDALVNKRVYKEAMPFGEALDIMRAGRGVGFDPELLDAFLSGIQSIKFPEGLYGAALLS